MASGTCSQGKLSAEEVGALVEETAKKGRRWNEERRRFDEERPQLIQVQPKPNEVPSARIPESESRLPLPQPNATPREFAHDQLCIPKEIPEQIPKFDGYNISARDFIKSCENATTKLVRYSIQYVIQTFKSRLMGSAYRVLIGVEFHTIKEFLEAVKKTFSPRKTANQYIGEIGNLRQNPNETVMQYACRTRELETALIDSIKTEFPENSAQIINKVETDLLKGFTDGITTSIRTELRLNGNKTLTDAIADAIALENKTTPNPPNSSYNRNNNNRNSNGRYEERYTITENRTYRFNYNQDQVKNVEDIIDVEEINDRRININKEVNIEEIDSREINKGVKLRKEKLNGKEINQNNFERKVGELGDGQATSDVDSHTRRPALEGKILVIIKCKEFMAAKPNEATSDVDKSEKIGEKSFNEERNETNQVLKNACETVEETEVEVGEIDDETTYSDFYKILLEIKIDKEFDIQHNPQELDNLFHENNSEAGVKMHNQNFYSEVVLKSLIISKDRLIEYNSGIKYKFGKATVNADKGFGNSIALCKPMALWNTLKKIFKNTRKRKRCYFPSRRTAKRNRIFRINIQTPKVLKSFNHLHRLQYRPRYLYPSPRIPLVHTNLTLAQY
ncbi:hypothetical protein M0802_015950 [Mischocyttarus mexicanus]|nr:hypothetical protein M0802_015950 [Mischocyttarus mexicanus]